MAAMATNNKRGTLDKNPLRMRGFAPNAQFNPLYWGTQRSFIICYFYINLNYNENFFTIKKLRDIFRRDFFQPPNLYGLRIPNHHNVSIIYYEYKGWGH